MEQNNNHDAEKGPIKILLFSASMRKDSLNTKLAALAKGILERNGADVHFADIADKADNGKPTEKISEKKTDQPETKPPEKSVDKPQDNKNAPTGMKP